MRVCACARNLDRLVQLARAQAADGLSFPRRQKLIGCAHPPPGPHVVIVPFCVAETAGRRTCLRSFPFIKSGEKPVRQTGRRTGRQDGGQEAKTANMYQYVWPRRRTGSHGGEKPRRRLVVQNQKMHSPQLFGVSYLKCGSWIWRRIAYSAQVAFGKKGGT